MLKYRKIKRNLPKMRKKSMKLISMLRNKMKKSRKKWK